MHKFYILEFEFKKSLYDLLWEHLQAAAKESLWILCNWKYRLQRPLNSTLPILLI